MTSSGAPLISARGLGKRFGELIAVDAIDFDVARGEAFGFLGPNGAGKKKYVRCPAKRLCSKGPSLPLRQSPRRPGRFD